jgi:hypothetical protein
MSVDPLNQLEKIIAIIDDGKITHKEFEGIFESLVGVINDLKKYYAGELKDIQSKNKTFTKDVTYALSDLELKLKGLINSSEKASLGKIKEISQRLSSEVDRVERLIPSVDFDTSDLEARIAELENKPEPEQVQPDTPLELATKINTLYEEIEPKAIKGWADLERKVNVNAHTPKDFDVRIGVSKTEVQGLRDRIALLEGGSGGLANAILVTTSTIDDSNTAFVFTRKPSVIIYNGVGMIETGGSITWTWNASTLTATLSAPVGTGGSIFGLK